MTAVLAFIGALLGLAAAVAVAVFSNRHGGYWMVVEIPAVLACIGAAGWCLWVGLEEAFG